MDVVLFISESKTLGGGVLLRMKHDLSWMQERFSVCQMTSRKQLWGHLLGKLFTLFSLEQCVPTFSKYILAL